MKHTDGLRLFEDLNERRITFTEFLSKFRELPREEQDRLLATDPKPMAKEAVPQLGNSIAHTPPRTRSVHW